MMEGKCSDSLARGDRLEDSQAEKLLQSAELNPLEILQETNKMKNPTSLLQLGNICPAHALRGLLLADDVPTGQWGGVKLFGEKRAKQT